MWMDLEGFQRMVKRERMRPKMREEEMTVTTVKHQPVGLKRVIESVCSLSRKGAKLGIGKLRDSTQSSR